MKHTLIAVFALSAGLGLACSLPASAEKGKGHCAEDAAKFCKDVKPGEGRQGLRGGPGEVLRRRKTGRGPRARLPAEEPQGPVRGLQGLPGKDKSAAGGKRKERVASLLCKKRRASPGNGGTPSSFIA